jgi:hypothetical protein
MIETAEQKPNRMSRITPPCTIPVQQTTESGEPISVVDSFVFA